MSLRSLENAVQILNLFDNYADLGVREIGRRLNLSKSTTQRLCSTLAARGYLEQDPTSRRYRLGLRLFELGILVPARSELVAVALPQMKALGKTSRHTVHLTKLHGAAAVCLAQVDGVPPIRLPSAVGRQIPLHCTSAGKIMLAYGPEALFDEVIAAGLQRFTTSTITAPVELTRQLAEVRANGYAISDGEGRPGISSLATPIFDHTGEATAALSISWQGDLQLPSLNHDRKALQASSARISAEVGWATAF